MVDYSAPFIDGDNKQPRCACVLVLDHSGSMSGEPLNKLNQALTGLAPSLAAHDLIRRRAELAVIGFPPARVIAPFCSVKDFVAPILAPTGSTPLGKAVHLGVRTIEERKAVYRASRIDYFRPILVIITDGAPDDGDDWRGAAASVADAEARDKLTCFAVGVPGADMGVLSQFSRRPTPMLVDLKFMELFDWLKGTIRAMSESQSHTGAKPSEQVKIPKPPAGAFDWDTA